MLPPVRCFTCNYVLPFSAVETTCATGVALKDAMDDAQVVRTCCRRMIICHPPHMEDMMLQQSAVDEQNDSMNYTFLLTMRGSREESTD
jgi:DNA-directed RNA polymerase subunit N (RpoN/RPB10)